MNALKETSGTSVVIKEDFMKEAGMQIVYWRLKSRVQHLWTEGRGPVDRSAEKFASICCDSKMETAPKVTWSKFFQMMLENQEEDKLRHHSSCFREHDPRSPLPFPIRNLE